MSHVSDNLLERLDAYLDGSMAATDRAAFERRMASDDALRREFEIARRIEGSLRGSFSPPRVLPVPGDAQPEPVIARIGRSGRLRWVAAAACVALVAAAALIYLRNTSANAGPRPTTVAEALYQHLVESGFTPEQPCKDDAEFREAVAARLGQPLLVEREPALTVVGWARADLAEQNGALAVVGNRTMVLLATVGGHKVVGLVDRLGAGSQPRVGAASGLSLFERQVGDLILYEITPLAESRLLSRFYNPDKPKPASSEASPVKRCPSPAP